MPDLTLNLTPEVLDAFRQQAQALQLPVEVYIASKLPQLLHARVEEIKQPIVDAKSAPLPYEELLAFLRGRVARLEVGDSFQLRSILRDRKRKPLVAYYPGDLKAIGVRLAKDQDFLGRPLTRMAATSATQGAVRYRVEA